MKSRGRSDHQPPTVDIDRLAVDVRGIRAAEERYQLAHLAWLTRATERNCGHDGVSDRPWAGYVLHAIRVRKTGADAVYVDLVGRKLGGEDLREEDEAGLRNGIGAEAGQALAAGDRADVTMRPPSPCSTRARPTALVTRNVPLRLTSSTRRHSLSSRSRSGT